MKESFYIDDYLVEGDDIFVYNYLEKLYHDLKNYIPFDNSPVECELNFGCYEVNLYIKSNGLKEEYNKHFLDFCKNFDWWDETSEGYQKYKIREAYLENGDSMMMLFDCEQWKDTIFLSIKLDL